MGRLSELVGKFRVDEGLTPEQQRERAEIIAEKREADRLLSKTSALIYLNLEHHGVWEGESTFTVGKHVIDEESGEHRVEAVMQLVKDPSVEIAVGVVSPTNHPDFFVRLDGQTVLRSPSTEEGISERIRDVIIGGTRKAISRGIFKVK